MSFDRYFHEGNMQTFEEWVMKAYSFNLEKMSQTKQFPLQHFETDQLSYWQLLCTSKFGLAYRKSQCAYHQHPGPGYNAPLVSLALKMQVESKTLEKYWCSRMVMFPRYCENALAMLIPFVTTCLANQVYSLVYQLRWIIEIAWIQRRAFSPGIFQAVRSRKHHKELER